MNFFSPYREHFDLKIEKMGALLAEGDADPVFVISTITPDQADGWLALNPGESVAMVFDIGDQLPSPGKYKVSLNYRRPVLIEAKDRPPSYSKHRQRKSA